MDYGVALVVVGSSLGVDLIHLYIDITKWLCYNDCRYRLYVWGVLV